MANAIDFPRAPEGTTVSGFWRDFLPGVLKGFTPLIKDHAGPLSASLSVRVTGGNGGDWSVTVDNGEVAINEGLKEGSTVTLTMDERNFLDAVTGKLDDLAIGGPPKGADLDPARIGETIRKNVNALGQIEGALLFNAPAPERPFTVLVNFKGYKEKPDCTVTIDQADLKTAKSNADMVQMFMMGKVKIDGMDMILKLMPLMQ